MNDGLTWIADAYPEGYALLLCEGISDIELLYRLSGGQSQDISLTAADAELIALRNLEPENHNLDHLDEEALQAAGFLSASVDAIARAGTVPGWAFALLTSPGYASQVDLPVTISYETRAVLNSVDVNATQRIAYARHGHMLSAFDPLHPQYNDGEDPTALPSPPGGWNGRRKEILGHLADVFNVSIPASSDWDELPAATLIGPTHKADT